MSFFLYLEPLAEQGEQVRDLKTAELTSNSNFAICTTIKLNKSRAYTSLAT